MNRTILSTLAAASVAGLGGYTFGNHAGAQSATAVQIEGSDQPAASPPGSGGIGARRWARRPQITDREERRNRRVVWSRNWGLFYPQAEKNLSVADVQTLAQALLLRDGNHTWKVANIAQNQDDTVSFTFTSGNGDIIARFAMDTHTGRLRRLG
jgi:hypothetical protein